jgi:PadR family transcriptional regulator PadR
MDSQLKKGILELCILNRIAKEPVYGYPVIRQVTESFPEVSESTVYAILRRLAASGYTQVFYGAESGGPERKYYRVTDAGTRFLQASLADWNRLCDTVAKMLGEG